MLEVREHSRQDRAGRGRDEIPIIEPVGAAMNRGEQPRAIRPVEHRAAVERVAPAVGDTRFLDEEVTRHTDPDDRDPAPARDLDQQHRQA